MLDHWSATVSRLWNSFLGPVAVLANAILIFIIRKHTPASLITYSVMILMVAVADCASGLSSIMTTTSLFPRGNQIFVVLRGTCELFSESLEPRAQFCMYWYALKVQAYLLNHVILIISFIYRMIVITKPFDEYDRKRIHYPIYIYSFLHFCYFNWVFYMALEPIDKVNEAISRVRPELIDSGWTYYAVLDVRTPSQIVMNLTSVYHCWFVLLVVAICRWRIKKYMKTIQFSETVKQLHKSILKVLLIQTTGPLLTAITTILFMIIRTTTSGSVELLENGIAMPTVLMTLVNPIITVALVVPYRIVFLRWFNVVGTPLTARISSTIPEILR